MTAPTHIAFAEFVYLLIMTSAGVSLTPYNGAAVAVGSVLPDIDTGASTVGRLAGPLSLAIERRFGHRTLTHSFLGLLVLSVIAFPLFLAAPDAYLSLLAGVLSHSFLDTATVTGVQLFYPFAGVRCVFPLEVNNPMRYRTRTGSKLDRALGFAFLLGSIPAFLIANQGYEHFVRLVQKTVEAAVRDYDEISRTHRVKARITAHNLLSKERIAGTFPVVGSLDAETLLFLDSSGVLRTLGREYQAEYAAEEVVCFAADSAQTVIRRVDLGGRTLGVLRDLYPSSADPRFFGHLTLFEPPPSRGGLAGRDGRGAPPVAMGSSFLPISITGTSLSLHFAGLRELRGFEDLPLSEGILLVRLILPLRAGVDSLPLSNRRMDPHVLTVGGDSVMIAVRVGEPVAAGQLLARTVPKPGRPTASQRITARRRVVEDSLRYASAQLLVERGFASAELLVARSASLAASRERHDALLRQASPSRSAPIELKCRSSGIVAGIQTRRNRRDQIVTIMVRSIR